MSTENVNQTVRDLAAALSPHRTAQDGGAPYVVLPEGYRTADLESLGPAPLRTRASPSFDEPASLSAYVNAHKTPDSVIYADLRALSLTAVIDHHTASKTAWGSHLAHLGLRTTPEWDAWTKNNNKPLSQVEFGEFLEEHAAEVVEPTNMLEVALGLEAHRDTKVKSAVRLDNGAVSLVYDEEVRANVRGKDSAIPSKFVIAVAVFRGLLPFKLNCLLRWRQADGAVKFSYVIQHLERAREQAFAEACDLIRERTGISPLLGRRG